MNPQASRWKYSLRPVQLDEFGPVPEFLFCRPFVVLQVCAALGGGIGLIVVMVGLIVAVALPERLVDQLSPRWDWVLMVSWFVFLAGGLGYVALFSGSLLFHVFLGWRRFRKQKPCDDAGVCQGIAPSDEIETLDEETLEARTCPGDIRPHLGVRLCLRVCRPWVVRHRKALLRVRSRRLERLLENVRRTKTRAALERIVGRPVWSLRTRRHVEPRGEEAEELLTETYHLGEYVICLSYKQGRVIRAFGAVNPCDWDCVLWEGDASLTDFAWPYLEIGSPQDEGAADRDTPPAN